MCGSAPRASLPRRELRRGSKDPEGRPWRPVSELAPSEKAEPSRSPRALLERPRGNAARLGHVDVARATVRGERGSALPAARCGGRAPPPSVARARDPRSPRPVRGGGREPRPGQDRAARPRTDPDHRAEASRCGRESRPVDASARRAKPRGRLSPRRPPRRHPEEHLRRTIEPRHPHRRPAPCDRRDRPPVIPARRTRSRSPIEPGRPGSRRSGSSDSNAVRSTLATVRSPPIREPAARSLAGYGHERSRTLRPHQGGLTGSLRPHDPPPRARWKPPPLGVADACPNLETWKPRLRNERPALRSLQGPPLRKARSRGA